MAQSAPSKEVRDLAKRVKPHGWTWERASGSHVKFRGPNGGMVVVPCSKFSDHRTLKNIEREFRKHGVVL